MIVSKRTSFDAAHFLPGYPGKCANVHGHHWVVEVACSGNLDEKTGMVIDFTYLKDFLKSVEDRFDHKVLNAIILDSPTAENIAKFIRKEFGQWCIDRGVNVEWVRVWETEDSMVEVKG